MIECRKYKAWLWAEKKMFQVERIDFDYDTGQTIKAVHLIPEDPEADHLEVEIRKVRLLESTGLKDTKLVEIYEGDICKYWMDGFWKTGYIIKKPDGFCFKMFYPEEVIFSFQSWIPCPSAYNALLDSEKDVMGDDLEIIGNMLQNPEIHPKLLETVE